MGVGGGVGGVGGPLRPSCVLVHTQNQICKFLISYSLFDVRDRVIFIIIDRKKGNVLFNDALDTFYLWLYCIGHMVKDHSDSKRENLLPPLHGLFFLISSKGSFICTIPQRV